MFDNVMGADPLVDDARTILDWITRPAGTGEFTRRDMYVALHSTRRQQVSDLDPALVRRRMLMPCQGSLRWNT